MTLSTTHFPLRKLDRDAPTRGFLAPEMRHAAWRSSYKFHLVYRFYDADLQPLYIGLTYGGLERWDQHRKKAEWWPLAEYAAVSFYESYDAIKVAEKAAIRHEQPRFNKLHRRGPANASLHLRGPAEDAAAVLFRDADTEFINELAQLLTQPERFPQPAPPPPARFADEAPTTERRTA
ncbi:GIY-YIG nuclease family protein [Streptomyces sp. NPDC012510]|uniref:GIY-YIG nuclease family protein n=1 Tax=Streptomyces sp. NPDC012510 TaxID=3364838 RepID=UPI0036E974B7